MTDDNMTIKGELEGAAKDLQSAVGTMIDGGEWEDTLPDLNSAKARIETIIATIEEDQ